jgi:hypothetical protein
MELNCHLKKKVQNERSGEQKKDTKADAVIASMLPTLRACLDAAKQPKLLEK